MKAFEMYDKNGDKVISKEEAKQLCKVFGESTIANLDTDGNGEITFEEFKVMYGIKDHKGFA
jgi:Ca2+-binding EF-hand superfamily protein